MFVRLSKNNLPLQFVLLILFSLILWGKSFVTGGFSRGSCWLWWAVCLLMAVGVAFMVRRQQVSRNPGMQGLLFLCIAVPLTGTEYLPQTWVYPLFLLSFYYIFNMYGKDKPYPDIFNAAFFWSAATIFLPDLFFTMPCLLLVLLAYAAGDKHSWLSSLFGMGVPYLFLAAYDFLSGNSLLQDNMTRIMVFGLPDFSSMAPIPGILLLGCVTMALLSLFSLHKFLQDIEMTERRKSSAMTTIFIYLLVFFLFSAGRVPASHWFPLFFPVAFFCTKFIVYTHQAVLKEVIFILLLALSVSGVYINSSVWPGFF